MSVQLIVAVTDGDWFDQLREIPNLPEANFWSPSDSNFRALKPGELFLFKLHSPNNFIVGGGVFAHANSMPCSLAWEAFGGSNGAKSLAQMRARIARYRRVKPDEKDDFVIGCRILTQPFFLERSQWLPIPESFALNTVTFKTYSTDDLEGRQLWEGVAGSLPLIQVESTRECRRGGGNWRARSNPIRRSYFGASPPRTRCLPNSGDG